MKLFSIEDQMNRSDPDIDTLLTDQMIAIRYRHEHKEIEDTI